MRHILQGFTMFLNGADFGIDTEEITLPHPVLKSEVYQGGGMVLEVDQLFSSVEALEVQVKMAGKNPDIMKLMGLASDKTSQITVRGGVLTEAAGSIIPHVANIEGSIASASNDAMQRGQKSGFEFVIKNIKYYRYEVGDEIIHEVQAWPPKLIVAGADQIAGLNNALGY